MANFYQQARRVAYGSTQSTDDDDIPIIHVDSPTEGKSRTWPEMSELESRRIRRMGSKVQQRRPSRQSSPLRPRTIKRLKRSAGLDAFASALQESGCVIISDFARPSTIQQANAEIAPCLSKDEQASKVGALQGTTRTVTRLIGRSRTVREDFFSDPLYQSLSERFLNLTTTHYLGDEARATTSKPLVSISIAFDVMPGTKAQGLHRDDKNHHWRHHRVNSWNEDQREANNGTARSGLGEGRREGLVGLFVPGTDTTASNGATRVIPGSHLWGDEKPDFDGHDIVDVEMQKGEAMIMLGSLYHGGGEYKEKLTDEENESRTVYAMFCCSGMSRQEEVPWLSYSREEMESWSPIVQERLSLRWSEPNLGWVDLKSPDEYFAGQR